MGIRPKDAQCAACDSMGASPVEGHMTPFCKKCEAEWYESPEYQRMKTARNDFVNRKRKER